MLGRVLPLVAVGLCVAVPAWAQWPALSDVPAVAPSGAKDAAVIVAVEDYLMLPDVPGAIANANEWETFLRDGLKVPHVHVLANTDATREQMLKFAELAATQAGEGGTVWWVFIGHGAPTLDGKDGQLVGADAQATVESLGARGVPQGALLGALQQPGKRAVVLLDASFSGRSPAGDALAPGVQPVVAVESAQGVLAGTVVLTAARTTEVAGPLENTGRPAFSYLMLGALRGWADARDGEVTSAEALYYAQRKLRTMKGRQQTPQAAGDLTLVLSRGVVEESPRVVAQGLEAKPAEPERVVAAPTDSTAALTLEYLQRRVVFDGKVPRQGGRILDGPAFYHAIGRPDLADKWLNHKPGMWITGVAMIVGGAVFMGIGIGEGVSDKYDEYSDEYNGKEGLGTAWLIAGSLGGSFTWIGGILATVFGVSGERHPLPYAERRLAAEEFNKRLREERGLGPEVDWQNQQTPTRRGILGGLTIGAGERGPMVGFSFRF